MTNSATPLRDTFVDNVLLREIFAHAMDEATFSYLSTMDLPVYSDPMIATTLNAALCERLSMAGLYFFGHLAQHSPAVLTDEYGITDGRLKRIHTFAAERGIVLGADHSQWVHYRRFVPATFMLFNNTMMRMYAKQMRARLTPHEPLQTADHVTVRPERLHQLH